TILGDRRQAAKRGRQPIELYLQRRILQPAPAVEVRGRADNGDAQRPADLLHEGGEALCRLAVAVLDVTVAEAELDANAVALLERGHALDEACAGIVPAAGRQLEVLQPQPVGRREEVLRLHGLRRALGYYCRGDCSKLHDVCSSFLLRSLSRCVRAVRLTPAGPHWSRCRMAAGCAARPHRRRSSPPAGAR